MQSKKKEAVCRNCGRTADMHDEKYCKSVHLGGVSVEQSKQERTEIMTKDNKNFEEEIEEILLTLLPYTIQDEQRKIYVHYITKAHKSSLERTREGVKRNSYMDDYHEIVIDIKDLNEVIDQE